MLYSKLRHGSSSVRTGAHWSLSIENHRGAVWETLEAVWDLSVGYCVISPWGSVGPHRGAVWDLSVGQCRTSLWSSVEPLCGAVWDLSVRQCETSLWGSVGTRRGAVWELAKGQCGTPLWGSVGTLYHCHNLSVSKVIQTTTTSFLRPSVLSIRCKIWLHSYRRCFLPWNL